MKQIRIFLLLALLIFAVTALGRGTNSAAATSAPQAQPSPQLPAPRVVDLKASDGTLLKATYFAAAKPGPGVLLLHQVNRQRKVWDDLAAQLAAAGINTLTLDMRGFGESGGTQTAATTPAWDTVYTQPGQLVSVGSGRLNLYCMGSGSPTVVFDSGWEDWAPAWAVVQPRIAQWTRACSYDRAGAGFSDPGPMPRTSVRIADELHSALKNADIPGPYILVGHAFGGDIVRTFADRYMPEVTGLVLVEADADDVEPKQMREDDQRGRAKILTRLRECRDAIAEGKPLPPLPSRPGQPSRTCAQQFFRGLPEAAWSPELNAKLLQIAQTKVAMYDTYLSEMEQMAWDEAYLQRHRRSFGSRPIRVLTTGNHGVGHLPVTANVDPQHLEYEHRVALAQARWLELSSNARQIFTQHSSEYVQFDEPDAVIDAVREVYDQSSPAAVKSARVPGTVFRDCPDCPEMVVVPAGDFTMGSSASEKSWAVSHGATPESVSDESPQHHVSLQSFALGKYDVTRGEYAAFVRETGYPPGDGCGHDGAKWNKQPGVSWRDPGFSQTERDPVVCVSWQDARAYVVWLNRKVRQLLSTSGDGPYRLPTEAEWEYAARAGTTTRFWWGDDDAATAGHAWYKDNSGGQTHPVGLKPANPFGLYDMVGDVWQWTEDCYADSYANAPTDGSATETGSACLRVDRGASWFYSPWLLRSATRERNPADYRDTVMGFRLARTLP